MKPARLILILVAVVAAGLAAFLVTRGGSPAPEQVVNEVVRQEAKAQVLVAKAAIGIGERLTAASLEWQDWPEGAVRPEYVTSTAMPDAPTQLTGAVVRFEFFPGEPIREAKLVRSDQGYLSAVLGQGMRGVSVGVTAVSSAGGFVVPNDHVDVVLTSATEMGQQSQVILSNVRVLAIGKRLGELGVTGTEVGQPATDSPTPVVFDNATIATLELQPPQAEVLINAATRGELSLTLRSVVDFNDNTVADAGGSQSVRLIRFGKEQSVRSTSATQTFTQPSITSFPSADTVYTPPLNVPVTAPQALPQ
jgi:pilus assembly protein CpaB